MPNYYAVSYDNLQNGITNIFPRERKSFRKNRSNKDIPFKILKGTKIDEKLPE